MALPAGIAPASIRLGAECLVCSATAAFENGQRGRSCTCDPSVPSRGCCYYTTRWVPADLSAGVWFGGDEAADSLTAPRGRWRTRRDLHPQPSRRQRVAPLIELRVREMVGSAGNAPVRHFRFSFATPDLQSGNRIASLVAGAGVAPAEVEFMRLT